MDSVYLTSLVALFLVTIALIAGCAALEKRK